MAIITELRPFIVTRQSRFLLGVRAVAEAKTLLQTLPRGTTPQAFDPIAYMSTTASGRLSLSSQAPLEQSRSIAAPKPVPANPFESEEDSGFAFVSGNQAARPPATPTSRPAADPLVRPKSAVPPSATQTQHAGSHLARMDSFNAAPPSTLNNPFFSDDLPSALPQKTGI